MFYFLLTFKNPNEITIMGKLHINSQKREAAVAESDQVVPHTADQRKLKSKLKEKKPMRIQKILATKSLPISFLVLHS